MGYIGGGKQKIIASSLEHLFPDPNITEQIQIRPRNPQGQDPCVLHLFAVTDFAFSLPDLRSRSFNSLWSVSYVFYGICEADPHTSCGIWQWKNISVQQS